MHRHDKTIFSTQDIQKRPNRDFASLDEALSQSVRRDREVHGDIVRDLQSERELSTISPAAGDVAQWLDVELVDDNPFQPRSHINAIELQQLQDSIEARGQLQAVLARPHPLKRGRFQLAAGHRRKQAIASGANAGAPGENRAQFSGKILCVVREMNDVEMLEAAFAENEDRADISVFDRANYFVTLQKLNPGSTFNLSENVPKSGGETAVKIETSERKLNPGSISKSSGQTAKSSAKFPSWEQLARERQLSLTPRRIRHLVEILNLPPRMQQKLQNINLSRDAAQWEGVNEKHCRALLLLPNAAAQQQLVREIEAEKLSGNEALRRAEARKSQKARGAAVETKKATSSASAENTSNFATSTFDNQAQFQAGCKYLQQAQQAFQSAQQLALAKRIRALIDEVEQSHMAT